MFGHVPIEILREVRFITRAVLGGELARQGGLSDLPRAAEDNQLAREIGGDLGVEVAPHACGYKRL